jgi:hypothetical protein
MAPWKWGGKRASCSLECTVENCGSFGLILSTANLFKQFSTWLNFLFMVSMDLSNLFSTCLIDCGILPFLKWTFIRAFPFLFKILPVDDDGVTCPYSCSSLWSSSCLSISVLSAVPSWPGMQAERLDTQLFSYIIVISSKQFEGPKRLVFFSLCICPCTKNIQA